MTDRELPALRFVDQAYDDDTLGSILAAFREKGYARLPAVFERPTVDGFLGQLHGAMSHNGIELKVPDESPLSIWAAKAPRIRQVLGPALSHSVAQPRPCLYMSIWAIQPESECGGVATWHKDREPDGMAGSEYHYPKDVFVGMYFEDVEERLGPTRIVPGSHRDLALSPYAGSPHEDICCRKEDAYLLDQRAWHCGTPRTAPGTRTLVVYGYFPVPLHYSSPLVMPRAQQQAWVRATKREDRAFFGGIFAPPEELKRAVEERP